MTTSLSGSVTFLLIAWNLGEDALIEYVTLTLEVVGAGVQETLMESADFNWTDTTDRAANFIGKDKSCVCAFSVVLVNYN